MYFSSRYIVGYPPLWLLVIWCLTHLKQKKMHTVLQLTLCPSAVTKDWDGCLLTFDEDCEGAQDILMRVVPVSWESPGWWDTECWSSCLPPCPGQCPSCTTRWRHGTRSYPPNCFIFNNVWFLNLFTIYLLSLFFICGNFYYFII